MYGGAQANAGWLGGRRTAMAAVLWLLVIGSSLAWNWYHLARIAFESAVTEARAEFQKDVIFRRWVALQGGVYVPPSEMTPPNPYLAHLPERDVVTTAGKPLTLVNPAYMTRQVHELAFRSIGARGHITSLKPLRPANGPDAWEAGALEAFERGHQEVTALSAIDGVPHLRLMRPLAVEAACLKCHASQGYRLGQVRGGISVSLPFGPYQAASRGQQWLVAWAHFGIGAVGLLGLLFWARLLRRSDRVLDQRRRRDLAVLQAAMDGFWVVDEDWRLVEVNDAYCEMSGYTAQELRAKPLHELTGGPPSAAAINAEAIRAKGEHRFESCHRRKDGSTFDVEVSAQYKPPDADAPGYYVAFIRDISDRRRADAEHERLRGQLGQAQRLEAVGRLAGGVAHDFNNMLGVILGYTDLALRRLAAADPVHADLLEVQQAANRSAALTRQLLAFARQQTAAPRVLDLNDTIEGMLKMLRRLIGENVDLEWRPATQLWPVRIDPAQIDQVLANLCVNARDAIAGVGVVTIETSNARLDEAFCAAHQGAEAGDFVRLSVHDTGRGMTAEVLVHVFEPFFTTKPTGEGTGLGLATVYGIVKQNGGFVDVESRPGAGTAFTLYLPRHAGDPGGAAADIPAPAPLHRGTETILLVEDEPSMLAMTAAGLRHLGYHVLAAAAPDDARRLADVQGGGVDLLLTDVIMPQTNGRALADDLMRAHPQLRVLYMSGYTADVLAPHNILGADVRFIQKPFTMAELAEAVRRALDGL